MPCGATTRIGMNHDDVILPVAIYVAHNDWVIGVARSCSKLGCLKGPVAIAQDDRNRIDSSAANVVVDEFGDILFSVAVEVAEKRAAAVIVRAAHRYLSRTHQPGCTRRTAAEFAGLGGAGLSASFGRLDWAHRRGGRVPYRKCIFTGRSFARDTGWLVRTLELHLA